MNKIFAVDGNWYLHRTWCTTTTRRPLEDVLPYRFVGLVMKDACILNATHVLIAFDGGANFRDTIYPEYKSGRRANREASGNNEDTEDGGKEIYQYLPHVRKYLTSLSIPFVQKSKYEGDDVLASVAAQFGLEHLVILGGQDKDMYQCLSANVSMYDSSAKPTPKRVTVKSVEKRRKLKISQLIDFQTLFGDKQDSVPQLKTESQARNILIEHGSIRKWFEYAKANSKKDLMWLRQNQAQLMLNKKLVTLVKDVNVPDLNSMVITKCSNPDAPEPWQAYQQWKYPKSKGLFR